MYLRYVIKCHDYEENQEEIIQIEHQLQDFTNILIGDDYICYYGYFSIKCLGNENIKSIPVNNYSNSTLIKEVSHNDNNNICVFYINNYGTSNEIATIKCWGNPNNGISHVPETVATIERYYIQDDLNLSVGHNTACYATEKYNTKLLNFSCWGQCEGSLCLIPQSVTQLDFDQQMIQLHIGNNHGCILKYEDGIMLKTHFDVPKDLSLSGRLECWGDLEYGKTTIPESFRNYIISFKVGTNVTCATKKNDLVGCWGKQEYYFPKFNAHLVAISTGGRHNCAISSGKYWCWGNNDFGQNQLVEENNGWEDINAISAGWDFSCYYGLSRKIECVGFNYYGQTDVLELNLESNIANKNVIDMNDKLNIKKLESGVNHTCVLYLYSVAKKGRVRCWGGPNDGGQLDLDYEELDNLKFIFNIAVGHDFTCYVFKNMLQYYTIECKGNNEFGQAESYSIAKIPTEISGGGAHYCFLMQKKPICVGSNSVGQLNIPIMLKNSNNLSSGDTHSCVIEDMSDRVVCWGRMNFDIPELKAYQMATGYESLCIVDMKKKGDCYGDDDYGQCQPPQIFSSIT